jgi:hypothetical protein
LPRSPEVLKIEVGIVAALRKRLIEIALKIGFGQVVRD